MNVRARTGVARRLAALGLLAAAALAAHTQAAAAAGPPPLSADTSRVDVDSTYGSGVFGHWAVDSFGMPMYRYEIDEETAPAAAQPELNGARTAWHQLGNDHIVADAVNHGYVQLWSQDTLYEWANYYEPASGHYSGGYGYLNVDGRTYSTNYQDRPAGSDPTRDFGVGYYGKQVKAGGIGVDERVYAPFGDDPILLHDVTLTNETASVKRPSWFEYWDVNPYFPGNHLHRGLTSPRYDAASRTITVGQTPHPQDLNPLTIYATALHGPVDGFETNGGAFFGNGGRASPAEVQADRLGNSIAASTLDSGQGHTIFAFRSPVTLQPGQSVTLRYAYGMARPAAIASMVDRYRAAPDPFTQSEQRWRDFLPQASFGSQYSWLSRELQWDAYTVRSGSTYEECAGHHVISQGGYYQYDLDFQGAYRDPLQHLLPMIYSDPSLAREVILYSAEEQGRVAQQIPYARISGCNRFDLGTSDDLDLWLLLAAGEYGLGTRDVGFFDRQVSWADGGSGTLWDHLKLAFEHQESQRSPHGLYLTGSFGDWSDFATPLLQMTESTLVATQAAYIYRRLTALAEARGDTAFATKLRATADGLVQALRDQWVGGGWYSRGYSGATQFGTGAIFEEPQPWAILAGVPTGNQAGELVANIRRFLTGVGAPGGPSPIGSSQSPAANDPDVTGHSFPPAAGVGDNHAVFVGGSWYALNGSLVWALGRLGAVVPESREYAWDEFRRNTLAAHTTAYPNHWDGVISVDDACRSWYSTDPANCGIGLSTAYNTQIMHQPAWSLFDAIKLAGVEPTARGYRIDPALPMRSFSVRMAEVGLASAPGTLRGYFRPERSGIIRMEVVPPAAGRLAVFANGRSVPWSMSDGMVVFDLPSSAGRAADWAVVSR